MLREDPRGMTVIQQPEYHRQMNGGPKQPSSFQRPAAVAKPRPTRPTVPAAQQPAMFVEYPRRPRPRRKPQKQKNYSLHIGIILMVFGFLFFAAFVAALVTLTVVVDAWPTSGLFIIGVAIGLLMFFIGMGFLCHKLCMEDDVDDDSRPIIISDPTAVTHQNGGLHPVWHGVDQTGADEEVIPMREELLYPEPPEERHQRAEEPREIPGGGVGSPVANGVPTPLAFTTPFTTTPNDYLY